MAKSVETYSYTLKPEDFDNRTGETVHVQEFFFTGEDPFRLPNLSISHLCRNAPRHPLFLVGDDIAMQYEEPVTRIPQIGVMDILVNRQIDPKIAEAITETIKPGWVISFPGARLPGIEQTRPFLSVVKVADVYNRDHGCHIKLTGNYVPPQSAI
jgi:hypothetical protein